ncbi:dachshund homolog 1-like [Patiria miniata]|uniref:Uncharacterized protein n=1 Tax=Patiria miniata TaxID=46514 RepID=A0A914AFN9_PATMI|nr:dachshund homolog 1-like [Patiria miniata]
MPSKGGGGARSRGSGGGSQCVKPGALGFKSGGVAKGSVTANMMSCQGSVKSGSKVAQLQSQGAKGGAQSGRSGEVSRSVQPSALGFKPGGVEKGSVGARMMSPKGLWRQAR